MEQLIQDFVSHKTIGLIGLSRQKNKFGNYAYKELTSRGFSVYPIHPSEKEVDGILCYPSLAAIKEKLNVVVVSVSGRKIIQILNEVSSAGIKNVWLQQGCESSEIIEEANRLGLSIVTKKCILMYAEPVRSIHKFHRMVSNIFNRKNG
jgi:predicted CoA-binding protein